MRWTGWVLLAGLGLGCRWAEMTGDPPAVGITSEKGQLGMTSGAARVKVPPGTFAAGTEVRLRTTSALLAGLPGEGLVSDAIELDAGGAQPGQAIELRVQIDPSRVPRGGTPTLMRWDGAGWVSMPTDDWDGGHEITGHVDHFSWFAVGVGLAVAVPVVGALDAANDGDLSTFEAVYQTPGGFAIHYDRSGERAPRDLGPRTGEHPRYVVSLGASLDGALAVYAREPVFRGHRIDSSKLPQVLIADLGWNEATRIGTMGDTTGSMDTIWIHNGLPEALLRETGAHELFHIYELGILGRQGLRAHRWWGEASAEWAASVVDPAAYTASMGPELADKHPNPVNLGIGPHLGTNDAYYAGDFVRFLERDGNCPGIAVASLKSLEGSYLPKAWGERFPSWVKSHCGEKSLEGLMDEYVARAMLIPEDGVLDSALLNKATVEQTGVRQGADTYRQLAASAPPYGGVLLRYTMGPGRGGTLVVRDDSPQERARLRVRLGTRTGASYTTESPPGAGELGHRLARPLVVEGFATAGGPSHVFVSISNGTGDTPAPGAIEAWVLTPVEGLAVTPKGGPRDPLVLSWTAPPLRPVQRDGSGALERRTATMNALPAPRRGQPHAHRPLRSARSRPPHESIRRSTGPASATSRPGHAPLQADPESSTRTTPTARHR